MQILPLNQNCLGGGVFSAPVLEQFRVPSVLISLSLSVSVKHLCSRCAATLLHLALGGCEQMRAGGLSQLHQPLCSCCIHISMRNGTGPEMSSREVLLAFVQRDWQEQTVFAVIEGIGSGDLRATAVSSKKEFCLVAGVYWR